MIFRFAILLIFCEAVPCIGQQASPATSTPTPQMFKSKEEAKKAAEADYAEAERLLKDQKADSLRSAAQRYQTAAREFQEAGERDRQAGALGFCGFVADALGQKQEALKYYGQELTIWRDLGNSSRQAQTLNDIGNVYANLGRRQEALEYYNQALAIQREVGDRRGEGSSLFFIGGVYRSLGQRQDALKSYEQTLAISHELGGRIGRVLEAVSLNDIAEVYRELGQKQQALKSLMQELPTVRELGNRDAEATALNNIGGVYDDLGQKQDALEYYRQALPIYHEIGDPSGEATALSNIGMSYSDLGQQQEALNYYRQALPIMHELGDRASEATVLGNIAKLYSDVAHKQEASGYYGQAYSELAIMFGKQSVQIYETLRHDISKLSQDAQHSFARSQQGSYRFLASWLLTKGRLAEGQQILDLLKQQEYADFTGTTRLGTSSAAIMTLDDLDALKKLIRDSGNAQDKNELLEAALKTARIALPGLFAADGALVSSAFGPRVQVSDLQRQLPTGTAVLYCQVGKKAHYTLLVTPGALKVRTYEIAAEDFDKNVREFRRVLLDRSTDPRPAALALYKIIIGDLQKDLDIANVRKLLWSLDDNLRYVPMQALYDGSHYLAERYSNVLYTQLAAGKKASAGELKVWAGGMSQGREGLPALPGVRSELLAIVRSPGTDRGVIPGLMVADEAFTAGALRSGLKQKYPLVHIASHFVLRSGTEDDSFLLLGDGRLSLADLRKSADYDMSGVELLTLSACDTAFGDGREIEGLATTAQLRGARSVMASLWEVNDPSTSAFMQRFYTELRHDARTGKAEALQHAELALLHGETATAGAERGFQIESGTQTPDPPRNYSHPYYWAPFILMGDWN
jgi:CHAT domain-containing protein/Flp pilus assembly protein TadD